MTNVHPPNRVANKNRIWYDYLCPHKKGRNDRNEVTTGHFKRGITMKNFENDYDFPSRYLNHYLNMCQSEKKVMTFAFHLKFVALV
jgi:hypothetical protein